MALRNTARSERAVKTSRAIEIHSFKPMRTGLYLLIGFV